MHKILAALVMLTIGPVSLASAQGPEAVPQSEVAPRLLNLPIRSMDDHPLVLLRRRVLAMAKPS
jgi:hypothetical protein